MNYQQMLDKELEKIASLKEKPTLLLHACCAPCSSYVLEYLAKYFKITVLFYNPNISEYDEYLKRAEELKRLVREMPCLSDVSAVIADHNPDLFEKSSVGHENDREGGARCFICYALRLDYSARYAQNYGFDYFTTTLSISPLKNAAKLNEIGGNLSKKYGVRYLYSDFKKREGYKRSIELSAEYHLYRQNFCGCRFSKRDCENKEEN